MNAINTANVHATYYWTALERKPNSIKKYNNCSYYWRTPNAKYPNDPTKDDYELFWDYPSRNRFTDIEGRAAINFR